MSWFNVLNLVGWLKTGVETPVSESDPLPTSLTPAQYDAIISALNKIDQNTDEIEITAESINLNTDNLESGQASILAELQTQQKDALTNAQLRAAPVDVAVGNFPATQTVQANDLDIRSLSSAIDSVNVTGSTVSVGNFPATQVVSGAVTANLGALNGAATEAKQLPDNHQVTVSNFPADSQVGTWGYKAGIDGTPILPIGSRIIQISATSLMGGTITINGGDTVTLPPNGSISIEPKGNLVAPTLLFTGTSGYFVEYVL